MSGAQPNIINFPTSGIDVYSVKTDRFTVFSGESHVVPTTPGYSISLNYVPLPSLSIPGFVETSGTPGTFQFVATYSGINAGIVTFNSLQSGASVNVTYTGAGDVLKSSMINDLQTSVENIEIYALANFVSGSFVSTSGGTMTGNLNMNSANIILTSSNITTSVSGSNAIGAIGTPIGTVYSNTVDTLSVKSESDLNLSAGSGIIKTSGNLIPTSSFTLGNSSNHWNDLYVDALNTSISLGSGVSVTISNSGSNNVGSSSNPLGTVYSDNLKVNNITTNLSGVFVQVSGDTMYGNLSIDPSSQLNAQNVGNLSGDLNLSAAGNIVVSTNIIPTTNFDLGSSSNRFGIVYANSIDAGTVSGNFVSKTGDVMTGNLTVSGASVLTDSIGVPVSSPSGNLTITAQEINVDATNNIRMSVNGNQMLEVGLASIYVSESILPTQSGTWSIGNAATPFDSIYANHVYYLNGVQNLVVYSGTVSGTMVLSSGSSITVSASGVGSIGSSGNPIGIIYANQIITPGGSGSFVSKFGDTIQGTLLNNTSGINNIGSSSIPFNTVFSDNVVSLGLENKFVHKSGDTMTGGLSIQSVNGLQTPSIRYSGTLAISGNNITEDGQQINLTSHNGPIIEDANTEIQMLVNGSPMMDVSPSGMIVYNNVIPSTSGTVNWGLSSAPFNILYANGLVINGVAITPSGIIASGNFVLRTGDTMTGSLNVSGASINVGSGNTFVSSKDILVVGSNNVASGLYSFSQGWFNIASGDYSSCQGAYNRAYGLASHAEGWFNIASGDCSSCQGINNRAYGFASHAEGGAHTGSNYAIGVASHAEGYLTQAIGVAAHAEGVGSAAVGNFSHSEGQNSTTWGIYSHAQGYYAVASGNTSFAAGYNPKALHDYSTVLCDQNGATSTANNQLTLGFAGGVALTSGTHITLVSSGNIAWKLGVHDDGTLFTF